MNKLKSPAEIYGQLFIDINMSGKWDDDKVISDLIPKEKPKIILEAYEREKDLLCFSIKKFVEKYFDYQPAGSSEFTSDISRPVEDHIEILWEVLQRKADTPIDGSSLIPLPYPYIVPGGRFNEIYYWDSYFTMLGLQASGREDIIENMVKNFAYLIDTIGFIPNGNRTYFLGRSQPPFFALMVSLLAESMGDSIYLEYLPHLEKEYQFWMRDAHTTDNIGDCLSRVIKIDDDQFLNRYYDDDIAPRAEMYATDVRHAEKAEVSKEQFYLDIRAACESGWDFSSRWFKNKEDLLSIKTTSIAPVDLNCLLYYLEKTLSKAHNLNGDPDKGLAYMTRAENRFELIHQYMWNEEKGFFFDYDFKVKKKTDVISLAGVFPLFLHMATPEQAYQVAMIIQQQLLRSGGVVTTPYHTGQQWDAPNGWAPLQWITYKGLKNYGHFYLADMIKSRWVHLCTKVYQSTGKMMEKYNVEDISLLSGGGEYPVQDGFGWSNGVLLRMIRE